VTEHEADRQRARRGGRGDQEARAEVRARELQRAGERRTQ
jgi:hypothetical protein